MSRIAAVPPSSSPAAPSKADQYTVSSVWAASSGQMRRTSQSSSRRSSASPRNSVWQRWTWAWMRPGMIRQPRQSRTDTGVVLRSARPSVRPTASILPPRTVTSARSTRHAPSCSSTSPPARTRSGVFGGCRTASGRDARLGAGGVVREVEVDAQLFQEVVVRVHAREDALRSAGIDQQVPVGIVEARQQDGTARVVREGDVDRVGVSGQQVDPARFQRGRDLFRVILQVIEGVGAVFRGHGVGRAQPKQHHTRLRDHARDEQPAVGRVLRPEPGEFRRVALLRHSGERPRPAPGHAQKRYQRADSHGWEYIPRMGAAEYDGIQPPQPWHSRPPLASKVASLAGITLVLGLRCAHSQESSEPPPLPGESINAPATITQDFVTSVRLGSESIVLEETGLDSLRLRLGAGLIRQRGDAASSLEWLCVHAATGENRWLLWLESGEMAAGTVNRFHVLAVPSAASIDRRCSSLSARSGTIELPGRVALGLSASALRQLLGQPSAVAGDTLVYHYSRHVIDSKVSGGEYYIDTMLCVVMTHGRVVQIAGWRATTS